MGQVARRGRCTGNGRVPDIHEDFASLLSVCTERFDARRIHPTV